MNVEMELLGENLKAARLNRGLSQSQVAGYLGIDQTLLSKIEGGTRSISIAMLKKLSSLYFCTLDQLLGEVPLPSNTVSFRSKNLNENDIQGLAEIGRIVSNLEEMTALVNRFNQEERTHG